MASNYKDNGTDLDSIFEPLGSETKAPDVNIHSAGTDISNTYYPLSAGGTAVGATNIHSNGNDLNTIFAGLGTVVTLNLSWIDIASDFEATPHQSGATYLLNWVRRGPNDDYLVSAGDRTVPTDKWYWGVDDWDFTTGAVTRINYEESLYQYLQTPVTGWNATHDRVHILDGSHDWYDFVTDTWTRADETNMGAWNEAGFATDMPDIIGNTYIFGGGIIYGLVPAITDVRLFSYGTNKFGTVLSPSLPFATCGGIGYYASTRNATFVISGDEWWRTVNSSDLNKVIEWTINGSTTVIDGPSAQNGIAPDKSFVHDGYLFQYYHASAKLYKLAASPSNTWTEFQTTNAPALIDAYYRAWYHDPYLRVRGNGSASKYLDLTGY